MNRTESSVGSGRASGSTTSPATAGQRQARALHRRPVGDRPDVQPVDLRQGDRRLGRLRRADPAARGGGAKTEEHLLRAGARRPAPRGRPVPADSRADERRRRVRLARGLAAPRQRCRHDAARPPGCTPWAAGRTSSSRSPARPAGLKAIEETIFAGVPVNVTLLFSTEQYLAAAEAYTRAIERRVEAGLDPYVPRSRRSSSAAGTARWPATSRPTSTSSSASHRPTGPTAPTARSSRRSLAAAAERRRPTAAASVGQHRHQGQDRLGRPLRRGARRPADREHDARGDAPRPSPTTVRPSGAREACVDLETTWPRRPPPCRRGAVPAG
jgi:hypothetical protein